MTASLLSPPPRLCDDLVVVDHVLLAEAVEVVPYLIAVAAPSALEDELGAGAFDVRPLHRPAPVDRRYACGVARGCRKRSGSECPASRPVLEQCLRRLHQDVRPGVRPIHFRPL